LGEWTQNIEHRRASVTLKFRNTHNIFSIHDRFPNMNPSPAYKLAVLVFIKNDIGDQLLLLRAKPPNLGAWSPIGGKLETSTGESPFECAARETGEETGLTITPEDLHLFAMIAEKSYEGDAHWLLFLFECKRPIPALPPPINEGRFGFFSRDAINQLTLPETDRTALWPIYDQHRGHFVALRADCHPSTPLQIIVEQITPSPPPAPVSA
jgi:8-oxo-dGTP diphosphatase